MLPHPATDEDFHRIDPEVDYGPALAAIAERSATPLDEPPARFPDGSLPVFAAHDRVIKLYPPSTLHAWDNERRVLACVGGRIGVPTPELLGAGALDGWGWIVMTRLEGAPLRACFDDVPAADRARLAVELGAEIARLHALDPTGLPQTDWRALLEERRRACLGRQRRLGLAGEWLDRIEPFLDEQLARLPTEPTRLLHTEIMREHVLVRRTAGGWGLSGLLDFEPSCVGPVEYELSSVGLFFSEGDRDLWAAFLDGLGVRADEGLADRCMAWALLHRYSNLRWWLDRSAPRSARRSFRDLAGEWFR